MKVGILRKGDKVISITSDFVAVERTNGEVDIIPLIVGGGPPRIDVENIITIGYGDNIVESNVSGLKVTTF